MSPASPGRLSGAAISGRSCLAAAALAFVLPLLFAAFSHQVWEDYYITFRSSRHLVEGLGLVYQPGERVHTFTSPLGVLVPAVGYFLTGSDAGALWFLRLVSAGALAAAAWLLLAHAREAGWSRTAGWSALVLGLLESKTVAFSSNGMETAFLVAFAALTWRELFRTGGPDGRRLAVGYGGLLWTRPDAFVLAGAMTLAWGLFGRGGAASGRGAGWRPLGIAVALGGLLYVPWFVWAWQYYGSPVPQTIVAKAALAPEGLSFARMAAAPLRMLVEQTGLDSLFAPPYFYADAWTRDFRAVWRLLGRLSAFLWLWPALARPGRAASFAVFLGGIYFHQINPYPWYFAPWTLCGGLALAGAASALGAAGDGLRGAVGRIAAGLALALSVATVAGEALTARADQAVIEEGGRRQIGLWLQAHARSGDQVFLESLGYIGYFSGLKMLDYPGLAAPEVSRLVQAGKGDYASLISALRPEWVVIRPQEYVDQKLRENHGLDDYRAVFDSDVRGRLDAVRLLPSRSRLEFDAHYVVFQRRGEAGPAPPVPSR